uniref:SAP domain-containing protein n=1 Tax=Cacopsylla melanoneura TaxID=428564 RepID=A0A8D8TAC2_9HEMI
MVSKMFDDLSLENLKVELGRRNLKTSGSKAELQSRLRSALEADGEDLDSMEFLCEDEKAAVTMEFLAELICKITDQCNEMSDKIRKELSDKMTEQSKVMSEQIQGINSVYPSFPPCLLENERKECPVPSSSPASSPAVSDNSDGTNRENEESVHHPSRFPASSPAVLDMKSNRETEDYGEVNISIGLEANTVQHDFILAEIVDDSILGLDFMEEHGLDIGMRRRVIEFEGEEVPFTFGSVEAVREPDCKHRERVKDRQVMTDVRRETVESRPGWTDGESRKCQQDYEVVPVLSRKERDLSGPVLSRKERDRKPRWSDETEFQEDLRDIHDKTRDKLKLSSDRMKWGFTCTNRPTHT